jgi:hypothetical protein
MLHRVPFRRREFADIPLREGNFLIAPFFLTGCNELIKMGYECLHGMVQKGAGM